MTKDDVMQKRVFLHMQDIRGKSDTIDSVQPSANSLPIVYSAAHVKRIKWQWQSAPRALLLGKRSEAGITFRDGLAEPPHGSSFMRRRCVVRSLKEYSRQNFFLDVHVRDYLYILARTASLGL